MQEIDTLTLNGAASAARADSLPQRVLRDTYRLLAATLAFSAVTAAGSAALGLPSPGLLLTLAGYFGLLYLTHRLRNVAWGLAAVFALTGFMGYTLGPLLAAHLAIPSGATTVATAMGLTALVFVSLSTFARDPSAPDMGRYGGFLAVGVLTAFGLGLAAFFLALPLLSMAVSGLFVLLMSGLILYQTQSIVRGGETNYVMATVTLYVAIYNLFVSLLQLLNFFSGEEH